MTSTTGPLVATAGVVIAGAGVVAAGDLAEVVGAEMEDGSGAAPTGLANTAKTPTTAAATTANRRRGPLGAAPKWGERTGGTDAGTSKNPTRSPAELNVDAVGPMQGSRLVLVVGKGGVGKTTVAGALALARAREGQRVVLVELDGKPTLAGHYRCAAFSAVPARIHDDPSGGFVDGIHVTPDAALVAYLEKRGLGRVLKRLRKTSALDVVAGATPGLRDVLVLGRVRQLVEADAHDLVVVDAPASGHSVAMLLNAPGLVDAVRTGPIREQALKVLRLLADPTTAVLLVTLAEELPVQETIETGFTLEDRVGVHLLGVVVNLVLPFGKDDIPEGNIRTQNGGGGEAILSSVQRTRHRAERESELCELLARKLPLKQYPLPDARWARTDRQEGRGTGLSPDDVAWLATRLAKALRGDPRVQL